MSDLTPPFPETAVVLAGGLGTRLRAAVAGRPKVLAPAAGQPFLHYVLEYLAGQGIRRVVLCVGYLADQVQEFTGNGSRWSLEIEYSQEEAPLGTAGALRRAALQLEQPYFALNGDTLFRVDLRALWQAHTRGGWLASVALLPAAGEPGESQQRGCVRLDSSGRIIAFDEKPGAGAPETARQEKLINGGIYLLAPQALDAVAPDRPVSIERDVFPRLAEQRVLGGLVQPAYFADIGTPQSLAAFERDIAAGVLQKNRN
jgi:mannose-1-phosphate guanylyltransferase